MYKLYRFRVADTTTSSLPQPLLPQSVQQDGDAERRESSLVPWVASADRRGTIVAGPDHLEEILGQFAEIRRDELGESPRIWAAGNTAVRAGSPRLLGIFGDAQTVGGKKFADLLLLLFAVQRRNLGGEILHGEILVTQFLDRDADGIQLGIQDVGAMAGRKHPVDVDRGNILSLRDILCDSAKTSARRFGAGLQFRLAGKTVGDGIALHHLEDVALRGFGERGIPLQRRSAAMDALAVCGVHQKFFVAGRLLRRCRSKKERSDEQREDREWSPANDKHPQETNQPRTRTALKLSTTWPPAVGRPKFIIGRKREKSSIWSNWRRMSGLVGPERIW